MIRWRLALAAAALLVAQPTQLLAQVPVEVRSGSASEVRQSDAGAIHNASRLHFPDRTGEMRLQNLTVFGPGDVAAAYSPDGGANAALTFYIYPAADRGVDAEAKDIEASIAQSWTARPVQPPLTLDLPKEVWTGWFDVSREVYSAKSVYAVAKPGNGS